MNRKLAVWVVLALSCSSLHAAGQISPKDLPERYRTWLQEEVVYIISPKEKDVFLRLETDRQRDIFIDAFWKQRDPTDGSVENEFRKEHRLRMDYANHHYGREATGAGWRTDMGRVYIILGPPKDIEDYDGQKLLYPMQIWTYNGDPDLGLPASFHVVFFKRGGIGNYVLYSPTRDGPGSLIPGYTGDPTNTRAAYSRLLQIEPNIAPVALSLIPGSPEQYDPTTRSFASDILISANIPTVPYKKLETTYAEKLLKYKDIIEVEYTANYVDNEALVRVIRDPSGISFVHYAVEPRKLSLEQYGSKFGTTLDLSGMVSDPEGRMIYQFKRSWPVQLDVDQVDKIKARLFSAQDMFPLIEGRYKFSLLMKNTVSKEFTSMESEVTVPDARSLQIGPLILAHKALKSQAGPGKIKPFLVEGAHLVPSPRNDFSRSDGRLYLFFQVFGLDPELRSTGSLELSLFKEQEMVQTRTNRLDPVQDAPQFLEEFDISGLAPANYSVRVALCDKEKRPLVEKEEFFYISHSASVPRPWVLAQTSPAGSDPVTANILGGQYLNARQAKLALPLLERAHRGKPESAKFAMDYARVLFLGERYAEAKDLLLPYAKTNANRGELFGLLGSLYQRLGDFREAVGQYKESLRLQGADLNILNAIGECYHRLGEDAEALIAWGRSLEIDPKQEEIRRRVQSLKKD